MLSVRQQLYKKNRLEGKSQYQSAIDAGYSHSYANDHSKDLETSAKIGMTRAFAMLGLTDLALAQKAMAGLEATKRYGKDGDVEDKDWATIHKFYETICTQSGRLVKNPINLDASIHEHVTINIIRTDPKQKTANGDQGNSERLHNDGEADTGTRLISLA